MSDDRGPIIKVENLTKIYPGERKKPVMAVDHIGFELRPGECLALIGESGSGKTTTVNMITRLIAPTEGEIFLDGAEITCLKGRQLRPVYRKMQMVFQSPAESFDPRHTLGDGAGESLRSSGVRKKEARAQVEELFHLCGLSREMMYRYPHEVSGGQCQRAAIARAIAIRPEVLILDEATSALDVTIQKEIMELLADLKDRLHMSYLFICHDMALVQSFCDRTLVMHKGRIVEEGTPDEIIRHPKDPYTKNLIDSVL